MNRYTWFSSAVRSKAPPSSLLPGPTVGCSSPKSTSSSQIAASSQTSMLAGRGRARCGLVQWNVRGAKQNYIWLWVGAQIVGKADTRDPPRRGDGAGGER